MKTIEYKVTFADPRVDGPDEVVRVQARNITSGFGKALKVARQPLGNGRVRELHSISFWQVTS